MRGSCTTCAATLGRENKSGYCRKCFAAFVNTSNEMIERRRAGIRRKFEDPVYRAEQAARLAVAAATPRSIEIKREHGRRQYRDFLSRPDIQARNRSPECRARAGRSVSNTRLAWCPPELRGEYHYLVRFKRLTAAEARAIIEAEIPGSIEHGRREVASRALQMRLKHERDQQEAY